MWVLVAAIAYFFHALNVITDKFLLKERIPRPSNYAFFVGVFGLFSIFLAPFGDFFVPSGFLLFKAFIVGASFTFALFLFFIAMKSGEASRVATVVGGFSPIFVLILSYFLLGVLPFGRELYSFLFLLAGGMLISVKNDLPGRRSFGVFRTAVLASLLFAISYVFAKDVFSELTFINGFIWTRVGGFLSSLVFLMPAETRRSIFKLPRAADRTTLTLFTLNKVFGALGFFLISYAIALGNVSIVNAMQGIEYALVFTIAVLLSKKFPEILLEEISNAALIQKTIAILMIGFGLFLLV